MSEPSRTEIEAEWISEQWGRGRTPTTAHPDCICGKRIGTQPLPQWLWAERGVPEEGPVFGKRADCPQHRPEPKR